MLLSNLKRTIPPIQIDDVYSEVESMNTCVNDMMNRLQVTKSQTRDLINETTKVSIVKPDKP